MSVRRFGFTRHPSSVSQTLGSSTQPNHHYTDSASTLPSPNRLCLRNESVNPISLAYLADSSPSQQTFADSLVFSASRCLTGLFHGPGNIGSCQVSRYVITNITLTSLGFLSQPANTTYTDALSSYSTLTARCRPVLLALLLWYVGLAFRFGVTDSVL